MAAARLAFHGDLRDLLDPARRRASTSLLVADGRSVKDAIEAAGVPHTEVDLILVGGAAVGFDYTVCQGDAIDVYGLDRTTDVAGGRSLTPATPTPPRFVLDGHLGRLARYLRLLGFDVVYDRSAADDALARLSAADERVLLTRDRGLLKRSIVRLGYLVRQDDPRAQLGEVVCRFGLRAQVAPFSRCIQCNGRIERVPVESVTAELASEPRTLRYFRDFGRCRACGRIYWPGSHFERMSAVVAEILAADPDDGRSASRVAPDAPIAPRSPGGDDNPGSGDPS